MTALFDHRSVLVRPKGGVMDNRRSSLLFRVGAATAFLCACNDDPLKLGDSDQQSNGDASSNAGSSGQGGGASGSSTGGSGNVGAGTGAQDGSADAGSEGSLGAGGSCAGGSAGQPWWPYTNAHNCQSEGVPTESDRPVCEDSALSPIYLAMSRLRTSSRDDAALTPSQSAWRDIGFDLDKVCTSSETCQASGQPIDERACRQAPATQPSDGNQCRDNQFGALLSLVSQSPTLGSMFGVNDADWNCELHRGGFGILFKISDYNGGFNDRQVRVDVYSTIGLGTLPAWTCRVRSEDPLAPDWMSRAPWRPNERWTIARRSIALLASGGGTELPNSRYADPSAFVRNGYLFARLPPGTELWLNGERTPTPGLRLVLHRGILTGALVKRPDDTWTIDDGTLGGVIYPPDVVQGFREIGFCENMCGSYNALVQQVTTSADALAGTNDILPSADCDALSFGAKFQARQAAATAANIADSSAPADCPNPKHPGAPRQGCICNLQGQCEGGGGSDGGP